MSNDGREDDEYRGEKEDEEELEEKEDEEEELERSKGATQARKVKLSLVVSESSWMYVIPNLLRVTWVKSGCSLRKEKNPKTTMSS